MRSARDDFFQQRTKRRTWQLSRPVWVLVSLILISLLMSKPVGSQLQQSGGAGGSTNLAQVGGTNIAIGQAAMAASLPVVLASNQSSIPVTGTFFQGTQPVSGSVSLTGATNVIRSTPDTSCGTTIVDSGLTAVPAATTAIPSMGAAATCMQAIYLNNTLGSSATCNVTDVTGPTAYVSSFSVPGNSNLLLTFGGIKFAGGAKWFCPTGTVNGQALGYQ